jgi:hypothetical protein
MTVTLCNNNPNSPNAVRLGNGIFGGRISSRDRYNVLEGEAPFPYQYQCWQVRDLQDGKWYVVVKHGKKTQAGREASPTLLPTSFVETRSCTCKDYNENYKKYGDGTWASFGFAKYACEHIRAVALYLDECRKDTRKREKSAPQIISEHTQHLIEGWGNLVKPHSTGKEKKEFWDGVRIYANRRGINPDELTKSVLKKLFPAPQNEGRLPSDQEGGVKSSDFWSADVKEKMAALEIKRRKPKTGGKQVTPLHCASCGARILPGKKRCSRCVDRMLSRKGWDPDQPDLPTTNAVIRNPLEKKKDARLDVHPAERKIKADKKTQAGERASPFTMPRLLASPFCKVHVHSTNTNQFAVSKDNGKGSHGEILAGGFSNRIKAKRFAEKNFPGAKIIVWKDI